MSKYLYLGLLIIICSSIQVVIEADIKPDLILILALYLGMRFGTLTSQLTGFIGALFIEASSIIQPFGMVIFFYLIVGFIAGQLKGRVFKSEILAAIIFIVIVTIVKYPLFMLIETIYQGYTSRAAGEFLLKIMPLELLFNALLFPVFYLVLKRIDTRWLVKSDDYNFI